MTNTNETMGTMAVAGGVAARVRRLLAVAALAAVVAVSGAVWLTPRTAAAGPTALPRAGATVATAGAKAAKAAPRGDVDDDEAPAPRGGKKDVTGKLNLNTATVEQLLMLPGVGPSKAERVVAWRGKHGPFKRVADLRKVKGFGYKTLKKLEPNLDVKGESTLQPKG